MDAHLLPDWKMAVHSNVGWERRLFHLFLLLEGRVKASVRNLLDVWSCQCAHRLISIWILFVCNIDRFVCRSFRTIVNRCDVLLVFLLGLWLLDATDFGRLLHRVDWACILLICISLQTEDAFCLACFWHLNFELACGFGQLTSQVLDFPVFFFFDERQFVIRGFNLS